MKVLKPALTVIGCALLAFAGCVVVGTIIFTIFFGSIFQLDGRGNTSLNPSLNPRADQPYYEGEIPNYDTERLSPSPEHPPPLIELPEHVTPSVYPR